MIMNINNSYNIHKITVTMTMTLLVLIMMTTYDDNACDVLVVVNKP